MAARVCVSHTPDLPREYGRAAFDAIARAELVAVDGRLRDCDVYVLVVGSGPAADVERGFDEATSTGIPRLVFLVAGDDDDGGFRRRLREAGLLLRTVSSPIALELEVFHALRDTVDSRRPAPPRELPLDVPAFTGRTAELSIMDNTGGVLAITGTGGVGKTALAVRWAHRVADRFPDGQLYVDLRGYDADRPMSAADALAGFLRTLGVRGADLPHDTAQRAARYRSLLAGRRMLVILDNASTVEQVRPLLPGGPPCVALVTSRDSLAALVARHGARRVMLGLLPRDEAIALLRKLIGPRVDAEPDAAVALAERCARLPLALRVAAELAVARPDQPLAALVDELTLDLLDAGGDPRTAVRAVLSWSYGHLPAAAARTFRLLGLHPGPDIDAAAVAALIDGPAGSSLDVLTRAQLVVETADGRYRMHDLLRAYAAELADEPGALARLCGHYLATAGAAMDALYPAERHRRPRVPVPHTVPADALSWLDSERANLVAVCAAGPPDVVVPLAAILSRYLDAGGHYAEGVSVHTDARRAAPDRRAEADALTSLGLVHTRQSRHDEAAGYLRRALDLYDGAGDLTGEARALTNLALVDWRLGEYAVAAGHYGDALIRYRQTGDRVGEARALASLGMVLGRQGDDAAAAERLREALEMSREIGDRGGEARGHNNLAIVYRRQGRYSTAVAHLGAALRLARELRDRGCEADALGNLGLVHGRRGDHADAVEHLRRAVGIYHDIGERASEADALNGLGEILAAAERPDEARPVFAEALTIAVDIDERHEQARAHHGLARAWYAVGERDRARDRWRRALALYTELDVSAAASTVRAELSAS